MDVQLNSVSEPVGTFDVALSHAVQLLERDPRLAVEQADEILRVAPAHPYARLTLGAARRRQDDSVAAYRHAIAMQPTLGEAYWSLANLNDARFEESFAHYAKGNEFGASPAADISPRLESTATFRPLAWAPKRGAGTDPGYVSIDTRFYSVNLVFGDLAIYYKLGAREQ